MVRQGVPRGRAHGIPQFFRHLFGVIFRDVSVYAITKTVLGIPVCFGCNSESLRVFLRRGSHAIWTRLSSRHDFPFLSLKTLLRKITSAIHSGFHVR